MFFYTLHARPLTFHKELENKIAYCRWFCKDEITIGRYFWEELTGVPYYMFESYLIAAQYPFVVYSSNNYEILLYNKAAVQQF